MKKLLALLRTPAVSALLAGLICLLVGWAGRWPLLSDAERSGYDLLVNARGYPPPDPHLVLVDFDDASVAGFPGYPVPRRAVAEVIQRVSAGNAELIGLDVMLSEARAPEDDRAMAEALRQAGNVIVASQLRSEQIPALDPLPQFCEPDPKVASYCAGGAAYGVGFVNFAVDDDGFIRRAFLLPTRGYPALPFAVALASNYRREPLRQEGPGRYRLGTAPIPLDDSGLNTFLIGSWGTAPARVVPAREVLGKKVPPETFRGKIVLIGESSAAGKDRHFTPVFRPRRADGSRVMLSGAEVHAAALATLLEGTAVRVAPARGNWLAIFLLAWLAVLVLLEERPLVSVTVVVAVGAASYSIAQYLFSTHHLWLRWVAAETALALALPVGLGYRFVQERWLKSQVEAEREQLMGIFSRYVSPEAAAEIWSRRGEIVLAGQERVATVLFSDIRNFTALTAGKPSTEVLAWLNHYLTEMEEVIREHGGFLNKFLGDGIMVLYGVPLSHGEEEDACRAVESALGMQERVAELNRKYGADPRFPELKIGVGIHTGAVTAGNVGSRDRLEYSVIGETVNLASRLESLTKEFKTGIVLSPQTYERVKKRYAARSLGETEVRGLAGRITVYTVERASASA